MVINEAVATGGLVNLEELEFLEEKEEENFEAMLEKEREEVQKILQSLEPNRLREN